VYDAKGRLSEFYAYGKEAGEVIRFEYDAADRVVKVTPFYANEVGEPEEQAPTVYVYNAKGQLVSKQYADDAPEKAVIDAKGNSTFSSSEDLADGVKAVHSFVYSTKLLLLEESYIETTKA